MGSYVLQAHLCGIWALWGTAAPWCKSCAVLRVSLQGAGALSVLTRQEHQELLKKTSVWVLSFLLPQALSQEGARFTELVKDTRERSSFAELTPWLRLAETPLNFILTRPSSSFRPRIGNCV